MPRVLSEQEYNAIQQQVLASMPKGLDEQNFRHMFPSMMDGAVATAENSPAPMVGSALGRFVSGLGQSLNPMGLVESIVNPYDPKRALAQGMAISDQIDKAKAARTTSERLGHYAAAAVPPIGIPAANAGETIGSGDIAGGMGQATGLMAPMVVPELLSRAAASQPAQDLGEHVTQVGKGLAKKVGIDPDAMERQTINNELTATRRRLQATRMRTRQMQQAAPTETPAAEPVAAPQTPRTAIVSGQAMPTETRLDELTGKYAATDPRTFQPPARGAAPSVGSTPTAPVQSPAPSLDLATLAKQANLTLSPEELNAGENLIRQGADPQQVVDALGGYKDYQPAPAGPDQLTRAESRVFQQLVGRGKTPDQAMAVIEASRKLQASESFANLPTPEDADAIASDRAAASRDRARSRKTTEQ